MSETTTGLIGEYICAASILALGWRVSMAQQDRVDMVAWQGDTFLRIQTKTANLLYNKDGRTSARHHFQLGHGCKTKLLPTIDPDTGSYPYDICCLVSPNARQCLYLPVTEIRQRSMRLPKEAFAPQTEIESWHKAVDTILGMRR